MVRMCGPTFQDPSMHDSKVTGGIKMCDPPTHGQAGKWCFYDKSLMACWFGCHGNLNLK